jgi:hypothetical protein
MKIVDHLLDKRFHLVAEHKPVVLSKGPQLGDSAKGEVRPSNGILRGYRSSQNIGFNWKRTTLVITVDPGTESSYEDLRHVGGSSNRM